MTEDDISDPAPMIQAICRDIGLTQTINHMLEWDEARCTLSPGQRVEAMIINCLMNRSALYQLPVSSNTSTPRHVRARDYPQ